MTEFDDVYIRHFNYVYKYVLSLCRNQTIAEDITSETFLKALKRIGDFKGECKMQIWLCQIAKNTYFSYRKREKKRADYTEECELSYTEDFERKFSDREKAFEIHKALHKLEEPYKEIFTLRLFGELSFSQIGELFGKTESWARVTYHRAKLKLREVLL